MSDQDTGSIIQVRVKRITYEAETVNSYELVRPCGGELPRFTAGGHIDLHLLNGLIRSYSLTNDQSERHRYVIAVNRDAASRGGSAFIHERVRVGDIVTLSQPRNNFTLHENADLSILIAGGIGITPLLSMIRRLDALGRPWRLVYAARNRLAAAFLDEIDALRSKAQSNVQIDLDDERSGRVFDLPDVVRRAPLGAHLYCCGPVPMLEAFTRATADRSADRVHVEYFQADAAIEGGFDVRLARSSRTVPVEAGKTILNALLDAGIAVNYSCMEGSCGTCETRVLEGVPDHRDHFLSTDERAANKTIMICCSGARSRTLVLDL